MAERDASFIKTPYTQSLSERESDLVRRILTRTNVAKFRTEALSLPGGRKERGAKWLEARKGAGKLWTVEEVTRLPEGLYGNGKKGPQEKTQVLLADVSFFDALYSSAAWEEREKDGGAATATDIDFEKTMPHFRVFAATEKIPFDIKSGMPVPVINGRIMREGVFTPEERNAAYDLKDNVSDAAPKAEDKIPVFGELIPAARGDSDVNKVLSQFGAAFDRGQFVASAKNEISRVAKSYDFAVSNQFNKASDANKEIATGTTITAVAGGITAGFVLATVALPVSLLGGACLILSIVMGGLTAACGLATLTDVFKALRDGKAGFPKAQFRSRMRNYNEFANSLKDGEVKDTLRRAGGEIEMAFYALSAREAFRRAVSHKGWFDDAAKDKMNRALADFVEVANRNIRETDPEKRNQEIAMWLRTIKKDPESKDFDEKLTAKVKEQAEKLQAYIASLTPEDVGQPYKPVKQMTYVPGAGPYGMY